MAGAQHRQWSTLIVDVIAAVPGRGGSDPLGARSDRRAGAALSSWTTARSTARPTSPGLGAQVVQSVRGYGAACHAGLIAATAPVRRPSSTTMARSTRPSRPESSNRCARTGRDLVLCRRVATAHGVWPVHARVANRGSPVSRRRTGLTSRPRADAGAPRTALLSLDVLSTGAAATRWRPWSERLTRAGGCSRSRWPTRPGWVDRR